MTDPIRTAMEAASAYLGEHPDEARYTDSIATARVVEGLRVRVEGPNGEALETDMPAGVGGSGAHPSPGWFMRAAVASCVASLATMRAAQLGWTGFSVEVDVDSEWPEDAVAVCSFGDASVNHATAQAGLNSAAFFAHQFASR